MNEMYFFLLRNKDDSYGIIFTEVCEEDLLRLLDEYKTKDEIYNAAGFAIFLNNKGIEAEFIKPIEIYF